ncbi:glycosyltransferase [Nocardioides sp. zg-1228]|uniref:glycosyltransferase n=1 Tax=Nocardioides sp. zg-1228 TaxID=2763008 RepID=UPI00164362F5|nr:glycosyltransferase [Nocardioides sp. zg-1228]MBC2931417.1 glycosyltransferase [Nocardioides sp. zg-1228]QSF57033.1 glycosyltransferase [Nocardioides sp. zg-1228]
MTLALAYHTWADGLTRQFAWSPDRLAVHLLDDTSLDSVVVANPLRSHLERLRGRGQAAELLPDRPRRHLVQPRRWRRQDSPSVESSLATYRRLDHWLAAASRRLGQERPVLVSCHPLLAAVADDRHWSDVVYYGWDDWLTYPNHAHLTDLVAHGYELMAEREVNVIGVTRAIVDRVGSPRGSVVPNGINGMDHEPGGAAVPGWFEELDGPVALYVGALQERVDVEAVRRLALDLPDWQVVLVGPLQDPPRFARLAEVPNVHVMPPEPRPVVLELMARATVCLIPHRRTPMSEAMSPLKLYEYLASGARVVATDLEPMRGVSDRCLLVEEGTPLAPAVLTACEVPRPSAEELAAFRSAHDWSSRYRDWRIAAFGR